MERHYLLRALKSHRNLALIDPVLRTTVPVGHTSPLLIGMHPLVRRNLLRRGQLDHVHRRSVAALPAGPAFQRGLELPDRRILRPADSTKRQARPGLAPVALHLEPA